MRPRAVPSRPVARGFPAPPPSRVPAVRSMPMAASQAALRQRKVLKFPHFSVNTAESGGSDLYDNARCGFRTELFLINTPAQGDDLSAGVHRVCINYRRASG